VDVRLGKTKQHGSTFREEFYDLYQSVLYVYSILYKDRHFKNQKNFSLQGSVKETLQFCGHGGVDNGINN
jgi:hypothetical protein